MAWIESHENLERHPKTLLLQRSLNCSLNEVIGLLHRFWWWTLTYCEDGQLDRFGTQAISDALGIDAQKLIDCGFIDTKPTLQVHDWWDYVKHFLAIRYKHNLPKLNHIKELYATNKERSKNGSKNRKNNPLPNLTIPNHIISDKEEKPSSIKANALNPTKFAATFFGQKYAECRGKNYVFNYGKDMKLIKELLGQISLDEFKGKVVAFFASKDQFICSTDYSIGVFKAVINKLEEKEVKPDGWRDVYGRDKDGFIN